MGLDVGKVQEFCAAAQNEEGVGGTCSIAHDLFPKGFLCSGSEVAINLLKEKAEGAGALQARVLRAGGAFHTSLMQPAQIKLNALLEDTIPNEPSSKYYLHECHR